MAQELVSVGSKGLLTIDKSLSFQNKTTENPITYNSTIYRGYFDNKTLVCVRKYETVRYDYLDTKETSKEDQQSTINKDQQKLNPIERHIAALRKPKHLHENFIRYFFSDVDGEFTYVATEWCICSVEDLYEGKVTNWAKEKIYTEELIKKSLGEKEILRQATEGLAFLHALGFVHRNLKPSNFLIAQLQQFRCDRYLVKLSDFLKSKNPVECRENSGTRGSKGWISPKPAEVGSEADPSTYQRGDVFILGCFYYYVLTEGKHPFGNNEFDRTKNINNPNYDVYKNWKFEGIIQNQHAIDLLKKMIKSELNAICSLDEVITSRYFSSDHFYNLYNQQSGVKPGVCVIINQEFFETKGDDRTGSQRDENILTRVFTQFGFDVRISRNLKAEDLKNFITDLSKQSFSSYASLVVCILSHGHDGVVKGVDGVDVKINELKYKFNSNDCHTLNGKPKIWIIQACQGKDIQYPIAQTTKSQGHTTFSESDNSAADNVPRRKFSETSVPIKKSKVEIPEEKIPDLKEIKTSEENKLKIRPPLMDFLDIRASISGYQAFRGKDIGSYLIQYLCNELNEAYLRDQHQKSLQDDILRDVQNHIMNSKILLKSKSNTQENIEVKQAIEWIASLTEKIKFQKASTQGTVTILKQEPTKSVDSTLTSLIVSFLQNFIISK